MESKYRVGTIHTLKTGITVKVVEKNGSDILVLFLENNEIVKSTVASLNKGYIKNPRKKMAYDVGEVVDLPNGESIIVIKVLKNCRRIIKFNDYNGFEKEVHISNIKNCKIANPYKKTCFGVGYIGEADEKFKDHIKIHTRWTSMIRRCYSEHLSNIRSFNHRSKVCDEWHNFQNFARWYDCTFPKKIAGIKFHLDKDLKQKDIINKVYSPENCIWLPERINTFINNIQRTNKSGYTGVSYDKPSKKYRAQIKDFLSGKKKHLGLFKTPEEASLKYIDSRKIQIKEAKKYMSEIGIYSNEEINLLELFTGGSNE